MDRSVGPFSVIPVILITLAGVGLAAQSAAQLGFNFHSGPALVLNPLKYTQNLTLYQGDSASLNYTNIFTLNIHNPSSLITLGTQTTNTANVFQSLTLTLLFNSTQIVLNGLQNQSLSLTLVKGYYKISAVLTYIVLTNTNQTGTWTISITPT